MHTFITCIANYLLVVPVLVVLIYFFKLDGNARKKFIIITLIVAVLALLIAKIGSWLYYNPRPFVAGNFPPYFYHPNNNGFPSDHTLFAASLAFILYVYNHRVGAVLLLMAIAIGLARVISGVHHLIDIVGAIAVALVAVILAKFIVERIYKVQKK